MRDYNYDYYCNGEGFDEYDDASYYADVLLAQFGIYKCVYTKDEVKSMMTEVTE